MMAGIEQKFAHITEDDQPDRCQTVHPKGQCRHVAVEGSKYCPMHGGHLAARSRAVAIKRQYDVARWRSKIGEFADHEGVKTLREEIGILRLLLETTLGKCNDGDELLMFSGKIADIVGKIEKLVVSCHRLEGSMGMMLDKAAALQLAGQMVEIISRYVKDDDSIDSIANELVLAIANLNGAEVRKKVE